MIGAAQLAEGIRRNVAACLAELLQSLGTAWPAELRADLLRELARQATGRAQVLEAEGGAERRPSGIRYALGELAPALRQLEQLRAADRPASAEQLEAVRCQVARAAERLEAFEAFNPPPRRRQAGRPE